MAKKKCIKESDLATFGQITRWIKKQYRESGGPVYVKKSTNQSGPFRVWPFDNCLLMMSEENAKTQSQQIMNKSDWETFCRVVKANPGKGTAELDKLLREELGRSIKMHYIPSFRHINKAYQQYNKSII